MPFVAIFLSLLSHPLCASACFLCWWLWATLRRVVCASVASAPHAGQWWSACLGRKGGLEKETATCSSVLPWKTHGEEPMGSKESDTAEWLSAHAYVVPCCCRQYSWKCSIVGFCGCTSSMWVQSKLNISEVLYILLFTNVLWSLQKPLNKGLARCCILVQYCCSAFLGQPRVLWFRIPTRLCGLLRAVLCCAVCLLLSCDQLFVTAWTVAHPPGSCLWGFSRQEHWRGLPFPPPGDLRNLGIVPRFPALQADSLPSQPPGKPLLRAGSSVQNFQDTFTCFQLVKDYWNAFLDHVILEKPCFRALFLNLVLAGWFEIIHANSTLGKLNSASISEPDSFLCMLKHSRAE